MFLKRFFERLFRGEVGQARTAQHDRATEAQIAYLEARDSGDRDSKALPCNQTTILPPPPPSKRMAECPIRKGGNFRSEF